MICPKCGHQQENTEHCEACGIYFEKYKKLQERLSNEVASVETTISGSQSTSPVKIITVICIVAIGSFFLFRNDSSEEVSADAVKAESKQERLTDDKQSPESVSEIVSRLNKKFKPRNNIERSRNATVFIETAWGSSGSGFIVSKDCWCVTNRHVLEINKEKSSRIIESDPRIRVRLTQEILEKQQRLSYLKIKYQELLNTYGDTEEVRKLKRKIDDLAEEITNLPLKYKDKIGEKIDKLEQKGRMEGYKVSLIDGTTFNVWNVSFAANYDLALFRLPADGCPYLRLNPDDDLRQGTRLYTIGSPSRLGYTVTSGIFSGYRVLKEQRYLQTDAPINPGNSGGPLITTDGNIVGINTLVLAGTEGIGFAIPVKVLSEEFKNAVSFSFATMNSDGSIPTNKLTKE